MEFFVASIIKELEILDPGELCRVCLALPNRLEVEGISFPLHDQMRPGTAFLAKPWGERTKKYRRRMYTRSNVAKLQPGLLETFINYTHRELSDTSIWWQSVDAQDWYRQGRPIEVRIQIDREQGMAIPYESASVCKPTNLRLEDDGAWESMPFFCVAFGTGVTPFLAYIRNWVAHHSQPGGLTGLRPLTLVVSAKHFSGLICHEELSRIQKKNPGRFRYCPVLTRTWPANWVGGRGRLISVSQNSSGNERIDISNLLAFLPGLPHGHLRVCGNKEVCNQILTALERGGIVPLSTRMESW